jgi:lipopolysaccharide export system protein LptA
MRKVLPFFYLTVLLLKAHLSIAQVPATSGDTLRTIQIIHANTFSERTVDSSTKIQILAGAVVVHEGLTKFSCDSAVINRRLNILEAFGNVRINQADSVFTSSQYLKYLGNERIAYLKRNVKLTDKRSTLTTPELEYNLVTGIAKYNNGGKVVNNKTVLTSTQGVYYEDTKDVYFIDKVNVVDPKSNIKADSLLYNTQTQKLNFIGPTHIKNKDGDIFTKQGTYDLSNGNAFFGSRTLVKDSSGRIYQANDIALDDKTGTVQMQGNGIIKDSANRFILTGNEIFIGRKNNSLLATKKPVMVYWEKNDTTYITGDTLFSGFTKKVYERTEPDSASKDSAHNTALKKDTAGIILKGKNIVLASDSTKSKGDTIRYFLAYHHVRVFNDSLQAVCDSLFYSGADSAFRLFYDPVVWSGKNQVSGDTIVLFTKNKKADRVFVSDNGIMLNRINSEFYNQVAGKTINGYFRNGVIDYLRVKGSPAQSIYFLQDKDSAFTGMNKADGSVIDMYFINQQLDKVKFLNDVNGKLYPMRQIPQEQKYLRKFAWLDKRRPKNKLELFE